MGDVSGFIVALIVAEKVGVFDKYMKIEKKPGTVYTMDKPGIPARPNCGPGKLSRWNQQLKRWDCILGID